MAALLGGVFVTLLVLYLVFTRKERPTEWFALREVRAAADEGFVYLLIQTEGATAVPDWERLVFRVAIDTYDPARGEKTLPEPHTASIGSGAEFLVELGGPQQSRMLVTRSYNPYPEDGAASEGARVQSPTKPGGFIPMKMAANRERFARDGERFAPVLVDRGRLHFGKPETVRLDLRADVAVGNGAIELRLPWSLLNVSDPSSHRVLHGKTLTENSETTETKGFRFYVYTFDRKKPRKPPMDQLPGEGRVAPLFTWKGWEQPTYETRLKRGASLLRRSMKELPDVIVAPEVKD